MLLALATSLLASRDSQFWVNVWESFQRGLTERSVLRVLWIGVLDWMKREKVRSQLGGSISFLCFLICRDVKILSHASAAMNSVMPSPDKKSCLKHTCLLALLRVGFFKEVLIERRRTFFEASKSLYLYSVMCPLYSNHFRYKFISLDWSWDWGPAFCSTGSVVIWG